MSGQDARLRAAEQSGDAEAIRAHRFRAGLCPHCGAETNDDELGCCCHACYRIAMTRGDLEAGLCDGCPRLAEWTCSLCGEDQHATVDVPADRLCDWCRP